MGKQSLFTGPSGLIDNSRTKNFALRDVDDLNLDHVIDVFKHVSGLINSAVLSRGFWGEKKPTQCRLKSVNNLRNAPNVAATSHNNSRIILFISLPTKLHKFVRTWLSARKLWAWTRILRVSIYDVVRYYFQPNRAKSLRGWDDLTNFENGLAWKIDSIRRAHDLELLQATER